jgi:hypothetical protein
MPEREFHQWLDAGLLLAWRFSHRGKTTAFRVALLSEVDGQTCCITRYDTAHGYAHRDVIGLTEGLRGKIPCPTMSHDKAFQYALRDIQTNADIYLADFLVH